MDAAPADLQIIATTDEGTRAALAEARQLAAERRASRVILLVPQIASPLRPPDEPATLRHVARRYRELAAVEGVQATVRVCVCRRPDDVCRWMVNAQSTVVLGGRRRWWWHTGEEDLARRLARRGRQVIFADVAESRP